MITLWWSMVMLFISGTMFSAMLDGGSGIANTRLTDALSTELDSTIDTDAEFIPVATLEGFPLSGTIVVIGDEEIQYASLDASEPGCGTFTAPCLVLAKDGDLVIGRGLNGTTVAEHPDQAEILTRSASAINQAISYNVGNVDTAWGAFRAITANAFLWIKAVPQMIAWDYSFLEGNGIYLKYVILYPLSMMFIISSILMLASALFGILNR